MSNLVVEILLRLAKAAAAAVLGLVVYAVAVGAARRGRLGRARAALLAGRRGLHPARGERADLTGRRLAVQRV